MKAVIETTKWADGKDVYNHVYLLDGNQVLAYIPHGTRDIRYLGAPRRFDPRGRTFQELKFNPFREGPVLPRVIRVAGSKGNTYEVDTQAGTCTCPGFVYRGHCRHLDQVKEQKS